MGGFARKLSLREAKKMARTNHLKQVGGFPIHTAHAKKKLTSSVTHSASSDSFSSTLDAKSIKVKKLSGLVGLKFQDTENRGTLLTSIPGTSFSPK